MVTVAGHGAQKLLYLRDINGSIYGYTLGNKLGEDDFANRAEDEFSRCKLLVLFSCSGGLGTEETDEADCIAEYFFNCGVGTAVCFNEKIREINTSDWATAFYESIGNGKTVAEAAEYASTQEPYIGDGQATSDKIYRIICNGNILFC